MIFKTIDSTLLQVHHMTTSLICILMVLRFLYYCGARVGETIEIKNEDVNIEKGFVFFRKTNPYVSEIDKSILTGSHRMVGIS